MAVGRRGRRDRRGRVGRRIWIGIAFAAVLVVAVSAYVVFYSSGKQSVLVCGATVTKDTTLGASIGPCSGDGLVIGANGISLNCAGHTINGTGTNDISAGISLTGVTKVTIKNCYATEFGYGLFLNSSSSNTLTGNTANSNKEYGFYLLNSSSNTLTGNTANKSSFGIALYSSSSNTLTGNTANKNAYGFYLTDSSSNTLNTNMANSNSRYGYYDNSSGSGTEKRANFYSGDECTENGGGSKPSGLCTPQS